MLKLFKSKIDALVEDLRSTNLVPSKRVTPFIKLTHEHSYRGKGVINDELKAEIAMVVRLQDADNVNTYIHQNVPKFLDDTAILSVPNVPQIRSERPDQQYAELYWVITWGGTTV